MTILINTIKHSIRDGKNDIIVRLINRLIKEHPENKYIILSDQTRVSEAGLNGVHTKNTTEITISKPVKDGRLSRLRYKQKVRKLIKQSQADQIYFIDPYFSFSGISQILLLPDCNFFHSRKRIKEVGAQLNNTLRFQSKKVLRNIVVNSEYEKQLFVKNKLFPSEKIIVVDEDIFCHNIPVSPEKRENVKETFACGNEYFLYSGTVENSAELITTLKAFSAFKKRQLSSMQLVITGNAGSTYVEFKINLQSYKFKDDVKIFTELSSEENDSILSSAYACIIPFVYTPSLQLFYFLVKAEVPIIAPAEGTFAAKKVAHFTPGNFQDLAVKMLNIFKDENLRKSIMGSAHISPDQIAKPSLSFFLKNSQ